MKNQNLVRLIAGVMLLFALLAGCNGQPTSIAMLESPSATSTPKPIPITSTPKPPTTTPTSIPVVASYPLVPRYMLPSAPYFSTEILGTSCNYETDGWDTQAAYIAYACPDLDVTRFSVRFTNLEEGQTALDIFGEFIGEGVVSISPGELLSEFDNLAIIGRVKNEQSNNSEYVYFMMYETESYVISVEIFFPESTTKTLEEFYMDNGEVVHHAVLKLMLDKVISEGTRIAPTPMSISQEKLYDQIAPWLVTESEMNEFYKGASDMFGDSFDGSWVLIGDQVDTERKSICREFEDRSNEDAPLVKFFNCVYQREPGYELSKLQESFPDEVVLESAFEYPEQSVIYGGDQMHANFFAFVLQDNFLFYVFLESRVLAGHSAKDVFNEYNDRFIYNVMMVNLERHSAESVDAVQLEDETDTESPFVGAWESVDPGDKSKQLLRISRDGDSYSVYYEDDVASSCGLDNAGKPIAAAGTGVGKVNGNVLEAELSIDCLTDPKRFLASVHVESKYIEAMDTIHDGSTIWVRIE